MAYRFDGTVMGPLYRRKVMAEFGNGLVMIAGDGRCAAQQPFHQISGACRMDHVTLRQLVAGDKIVQCAAAPYIQRLHAAADGEDGTARVYKGLYQQMLLPVKLSKNITAAGQQQSGAAAAFCRVVG